MKDNSDLDKRQGFDDAIPTAEADSGSCAAAVPPFDPQTYWAYLDGMALTDDQKAALLETLWSIMSGFVALGFGVDPVQQLVPALVHGAWAADSDGVKQKEARQSFNGAVCLHDKSDTLNFPAKENGHG
jgi:hypothetical protein